MRKINAIVHVAVALCYTENGETWVRKEDEQGTHWYKHTKAGWITPPAISTRKLIERDYQAYLKQHSDSKP